VPSCIISAKSDNRPSYGDSDNSRWPLSAIWDYGGKHIWTTPHVVGPHYTSNLVKISGSATEICPQNGIQKTLPGGGILLPVPTLTPSVFGTCVVSKAVHLEGVQVVEN